MAYALLSSIVAALLVLYYVASIISKRITVYNFAKRHGCLPPNRFPQSERILGLGFLWGMRNVIKEKRLLTALCERHDETGETWEARALGTDIVCTRDPEVIKAILSTQFKDFGLGGRYVLFKPLLGRGIFTSDDAHWEYSRALVRPNFAKHQVADLDLFEEHIQDVIARIPTDGTTIDLQPLFFSLTLDSATEFLFGTSVNSLRIRDANSPTFQFGKSFDFAQQQISQAARSMTRIQNRKDFDAACKICRDFVDQYIKGALDNLGMGKFGDEKLAKTDKQKYVFLDELAKSTNDPVRLRDELMNVLLAGRDTTASLLSNTFHVLARRPDIWAKLQAEVEGLNGQRPTYETLRNMQYLKHVLNESLRLFPVVPANARYAKRDTILSRGGGPDGQSPMFIPKGGLVFYSVWSMHRRKDVYGPDADEFRPERWAAPETLSASSSTNSVTDGSKFNPNVPLRPGWGYLPFNGGPRICPGQQFALTEASYTMVRMLQTFKGIATWDERSWQENLGLTVCCANGVVVSLTKG